MDELVRDGTAGRMADNLAEAAAKGAVSAEQADWQGGNIPLGAGLQAGFWRLMWVEASLQAWDGCERCGSY